MASEGKQRVRWRSVGVCLLTIFGGLYLLSPAVQHVMVWYFAHSEAAKASFLVPQTLPNTHVDTLKDGETLVSFGFSIRVPWRIAKRENLKSLTSLQFDNGARVTILDQSSNKMAPTLLENAAPREVKTYKAMYGSLALSSNYEFLKAELNALPTDVSFWRSNAANAGVLVQLSMKQPFSKRGSVLYSIQTGDVHGFQSGDTNSPVILLMLFDGQDRELWILINRSAGVGMTQEQLNGIASSITHQ